MSMARAAPRSASRRCGIGVGPVWAASPEKTIDSLRAACALAVEMRAYQHGLAGGRGKAGHTEHIAYGIDDQGEPPRGHLLGELVAGGFVIETASQTANAAVVGRAEASEVGNQLMQGST